jgi:lipopolysaccharide export system protein LptC
MSPLHPYAHAVADAGTQRARRPLRRSSRAMFGPRAVVRFHRGYSRFVGLMKVFLPTIAAILVLTVAIWPHLNSDKGFRLGLSSLVVGDSGKNDVVNPRLVGVDGDNQPFTLTADLAKNVSFKTQIEDFWRTAEPIELEMPKADMTLRDGSWLVLTAKSGILNPSSKKLDLEGAVNLFHDSGYEFRTARAQIDLSAGAASGNDPVEGQGPFGHLTAEGFHLKDKGKSILFTGKAKLVINPGLGQVSG